MLSYIKAFTIFFLWAAIALATHHYISNGYFNHCSIEKTTPLKKETFPNHGILITDASNKIIFEFSNSFEITKNNAHIPSLKTIPFLKDSIFNYLSNNYSEELLIIGKLNEIEANQLNTKNVGIDRAKSLKKELTTFGIQPSKIKILSKTKSYSYDKNNSFWNGIDLKFNTIKQTVIDSIEQVISHKTLYINFEDEEITPSEGLMNYTQLLAQFVTKYPHKNIEIIGHTDNLGYYDKNYLIGLNRANKLKEYFISKNINSTKIKTSSKGESEPIADKRTEEGRAKNKRIQILIN